MRCTLLLASLLYASPALAQTPISPQPIPSGQGIRGPKTVKPATVRVASGLASPTGLTHAPGDSSRVFIMEQRLGTIRILDLNTLALLPTPFLDINSLVIGTGDERGLLGLAFHPDYSSNGLFYVNYNNNSGSTVIAEYQVSANPDLANAASARILMTIGQPQSNHNGGWMGFSPLDQYLYIATGDGGNFCDTGSGHTSGIGNAQDTTDNLLGKILRIDPAGSPYAIPADNPFVGVVGDDEIWSYGLRNPWRASFDRLTGDLYIGDVGQDIREEVNFQPAASSGGINYGWRCREGLSCSTTGASGCLGTTGCNCPAADPALEDPILQYRHSPPPAPAGFVCTVIGGYVYRGSAVTALDGAYLYADYCGNALWSFRVVGGVLTAPRDRTAQLTPSLDGFSLNTITSFGEDNDGEMYIVDRGGEIFKIVPHP